MAAPLQYLLINVNVVALEKISFSNTQNPKTVCKRIDSRWQAWSALRDNLRQPIQMQFSQKQKGFSEYFFAFSKSILNFKHFQKKDDPQSWCISGNTGSEKHG